MSDKTRSLNGIWQLDLHGVRHGDVINELNAFLYEYRTHSPLLIITGNSHQMREIVHNYLRSINAQWDEGMPPRYATTRILRF